MINTNRTNRLYGPLTRLIQPPTRVQETAQEKGMNCWLSDRSAQGEGLGTFTRLNSTIFSRQFVCPALQVALKHHRFGTWLPSQDSTPGQEGPS